jgi:hypothetical protein
MVCPTTYQILYDITADWHPGKRSGSVDFTCNNIPDNELVPTGYVLLSSNDIALTVDASGNAGTRVNLRVCIGTIRRNDSLVSAINHTATGVSLFDLQIINVATGVEVSRAELAQAGRAGNYAIFTLSSGSGNYTYTMTGGITGTCSGPIYTFSVASTQTEYTTTGTCGANYPEMSGTSCVKQTLTSNAFDFYDLGGADPATASGNGWPGGGATSSTSYTTTITPSAYTTTASFTIPGASTASSGVLRTSGVAAAKRVGLKIKDTNIFYAPGTSRSSSGNTFYSTLFYKVFSSGTSWSANYAAGYVTVGIGSQITSSPNASYNTSVGGYTC